MTEIIILDDEDIKNLKNDIPISLILNDGTKIEIVNENYLGIEHMKKDVHHSGK